MRRTHTSAFFLVAAIVLATSFATSKAHAAQRTFVSAATGVDTHTTAGCTAVAPCRNFQAAMTRTDPNGEVVVLDSGGYDAVTIGQSVTLVAPAGVYAGISVLPGTDGITIAASNINVALRGLTITGQGGNNGIIMNARQNNRLTVENCEISNLKQSGVQVSGSVNVGVTDTIIRDNFGSGISFEGGVSGTIARSIISGNNNNGIVVGGSPVSITVVSIADSTIDGNGGDGVRAASNNVNAIAKVSIRDSRVVRNSGYGLVAVYNGPNPMVNAGISAKLSASNNLISKNGVGIGALSARVTASGNVVTDNSSFGFENSGIAPSVLFESAFNNVFQNNNIGGIIISGQIAFFGRE
jgi:Right handed beta helix region